MPTKKKPVKSKEENSPKESAGSTAGVIAAGVVLIACIGLVAMVFQNFQNKLNSEVTDLNSMSQKTEAELLSQIEQLKEELLKSDESTAQELNERLQRLELASQANCAKYGDDWRTFTDTDLGWSFCYPEDWGETKKVPDSTSPECREGFENLIAFNELSSPKIFYSSINHKLKCDTDAPPFCWSCLDPTITEPELLQNLGFINSRGVSMEKISLKNGQLVYKLEADLKDLNDEVYQTVGYYIPNLIIGDGHNVEVSSNGNERELTTVINSMYIAQNSY